MLYLVNPRRVWSSTRTRMYERPEAGARDLITDMVPENEIAAFVISEPVSPMTAVQHVGHFRAQGVAALATQGRAVRTLKKTAQNQALGNGPVAS